MLLNYRDILKPDVDELSANSAQRLWILQSMIDAVDHVKELLERRVDRAAISSNGEVKRFLSARKLHAVRLVFAGLKLNYHPLNISLSLSGVFGLLYVR